MLERKLKQNVGSYIKTNEAIFKSIAYKQYMKNYANLYATIYD